MKPVVLIGDEDDDDTGKKSIFAGVGLQLSILTRGSCYCLLLMHSPLSVKLYHMISLK